jgi:hypothetical protein
VTANLRIYVYGFCAISPDRDLALPLGIAGQTEMIQVGSLGAIAEAHLDIPALKTNDQQLMTAILSHDRVLQAVFDQLPVLPLRFGTQFAQASALHDYLHRQQQPHLQRLGQLVDKAEYLLKLTPKPPDSPPLADALKGRDYFVAKKRRLQAEAAHQQAQQQQLQTLFTHLGQTHDAVVLGSAQDDRQRLHLLAHRDNAMAENSSQWQAIAPAWDITCSDPLPPYHFSA